MTATAMPRTAAPSLPLVAVVCTMLAFALVQVAALISTGGAFEYPLDDVYIHLAMAEQIAQGGYGINAGEYASAASSPLYPLLLVPFAGTEAQRLLPLVWNTIGLAVAAGLWGRILVQGGYDRMQARWPGLALAALGPLAVNFPGLGFVGMEHALHLAASLAVLSGLIQTVQTGRVGPLLVAGAVLSPALRLEGLALSLLAAAAVVALGHWRRGLALGVASVLPVLIFSGFLLSIGLNALPNSVEAKLIGPGEEDIGRLMRMVGTFLINTGKLPGMVMLGFSLLAMIVGMALNRAGNPGGRLVAYVICIAGFAHLFLAQIGWLNRYEVYILAVLGAGLAWSLAQLPATDGSRRGLALLFAAGLAVSGTHYTLEMLFAAPRAALGHPPATGADGAVRQGLRRPPRGSERHRLGRLEQPRRGAGPVGAGVRQGAPDAHLRDRSALGRGAGARTGRRSWR